MNILNLHGFLGAADNRNYHALKCFLPDTVIQSPNLREAYQNEPPRDLLERLAAMTDSETVLVGQSLGSWYANQLSLRTGRPCIITNPAYFPHKLPLITDLVPEEFAAEYAELTDTRRNPAAVSLCADADTLLPGNITNCERFSAQVIRVHGGHSGIEDLDVQLKAAFGALGICCE